MNDPVRVCFVLLVFMSATTAMNVIQSNKAQDDTASHWAAIHTAIAQANATASQADKTADAAAQVLATIEKGLEKAADGAMDAIDRDNSLRCGLYYLADSSGERRALTSQPRAWGLKKAPVIARWLGFPDDWNQCDICAEGYLCNTPGPRGGAKL